MNSREINDDLVKERLLFREKDICGITTAQNKKHYIIWWIFLKLMNSIQKQNKLDANSMDYVGHWNEKYYRNGDVDGIQIAMDVLRNKIKGKIILVFYLI